MGNDHRIGTLNHILSGHGQAHQRITQLTAVSVRKARVSSLFGQHRINQKGGLSVCNLDGGIADLLYLVAGFPGIRFGESSASKNSRSKHQGASESFDQHGIYPPTGCSLME